MELPQSCVQYRRGPYALGPKDTVGINCGAATLRKLELTKQRCHTVEDSERIALAKSSSFESQALNGPKQQEQQQLSNGRRVGHKLWPRPLSARESPTNPQLVNKTVAFGGRGEPTSGQSMQASFFPLLVGDDDMPDKYRGRHVDNPDSNFDGITTRSFASGGETGLQHHASNVPMSSGGALKDTSAAYISSRLLISKPVHQRKRGVGQPLRAHYALSPRCATEGSRTSGGVEAFTEPTSTGGVRARGSGLGSGRKPFTSGSLALTTEASATSIVDRAGMILSTSTKTSCISYPGGGSEASPHSHSDVRHHSRSATSSAASSPRVASPASYTPDSSFRVVAPTQGIHRSCGAYYQASNGAERGSGGGVVDNYASGEEASNNDSARLESLSGRGGSSPAIPSKRRSHSAESRGFRQDDAAKSSSGAMTLINAEEQAGGSSTEGFMKGEDERAEGVLLPGPKGGVEVRQLDGGILVVRRSRLEKRWSPEKLNLHRRQLKSCPLIQGDSRLRLLDYQNNLISKITNLANLPNLIFLDLYNNHIDTLEGSLASTSGLRVVMVGKNRIDKISNLESLRKLDVLDLHSNAIRGMEGFDALQELRVLNLAGNRVRIVENVSCLTALTELNLRRNMIEKVMELDVLPRLQRLFLSNNRIRSFSDCQCIFSLESLVELSLDGNPVAKQNGVGSRYRRSILQRLPSLLHLDLRRVNNRDRPYPDADNSVVQQSRNHPDGNDSVCSRSPLMSQTVATSEGAVCKNSSLDTKCSVNSHTLPGLINGNGSQTTINEQGKACDPPHSHCMMGKEARVSPRNKEGQYWPSMSTTTSKRDARCQEREGMETATPRPHGGARGSCWTCWIGKNKAGGGPSGAECAPRRESCNGRTQASSSPSGKNDVESCGATVSRAVEAREAIEAEFARVGKGDQEKRALMERESAIATARKCWESKISGSRALGTRSRSRRLGNASLGTDRKRRSNHQAPSSTVANSCIRPKGRASSLSSSSTQSLTPPDHRSFSTSKLGGGSGGSSANAITEGSTGGRRSKDQGRTVGAMSGGVGYFELEQRLQEDGARLEAAGSDLGSGITLKVYGDVWRWLSNGRVCSLRGKVVGVHFSYVHVDRLARKATAIVEAFPNLSSLRLLDNDIRTFKQLEYLRPLTKNLVTLDLGNNPVVRSASTVALQTWVQAQGTRLTLAIASRERPNQPLHQSLRPEGSNQLRPPSPPEKDLALPQGATPKSRAGYSGSSDRLVAAKSATGHCLPVVMHENNERGREEDTERAAEVDLVAARWAFARLAEAQERARSTSWGNVALPAGWGLPGRQSKLTAPALNVGVENAWAASDRAAKLACNRMIRKVCETHRNDVEFDRAWEAVIRTIVQEILAAGEPLEITPSPLDCSNRDGDQSKASSTLYQEAKSPPSVHAREIGTGKAFRTHPPSARWLDEF